MSKKMKRLFAALLAAGMTASIAGCGSAGSGASSSAPPAGGESAGSSAAPSSAGSAGSKITMAVSGSAQEIQIHQNKVDKYKETRPDAEIELIDIGAERIQKTLTLISAGDAPDILYINEYLYGFADKGVLRELDDLIARDGFDVGQYQDSLMEPLRYNGKLYALPQEVSPFVIYYNKDMFNAAGVPLPTDSWTVDEFYDACQKLTNPAEKVYGYRHPTNWPDQILGWISRAGVDFDLTNNPDCLSSPEMLDALNFLNKMVYTDKVSPNPADLQAMGKGADVMFRNQKVAMESAGLWVLPTYKAEPLPFEWDVVRMPKGVNQRTKAGILNWAISAQSENVDAAWDFMQFMVGPEGMKIVAESNMALPASDDEAANQVVLDTHYPENVKCFIDSVPDVDFLDQKSIFRNESNTELNAQVELMLLGKQSPEDTQKALVEKIGAILQQ